MADVLSQIPGLAGYLAMENQRRQAAMADLKGVSGLASLLQQQREAALQEQMAPLKMQALQAQVDQQRMAAEDAQRRRAFFTPENFQRFMTPGSPAVAPGQGVTGGMDSGGLGQILGAGATEEGAPAAQPGSAPRLDIDRMIASAVSQGVLNPETIINRQTQIEQRIAQREARRQEQAEKFAQENRTLAERQAFAAQQQRQRAEDQEYLLRVAASLRPAPQPRQDPLVQVEMPDPNNPGQKVLRYVPQSQAAGMSPPTQTNQNRPPVGYRWTADGNQEVIPGGPADVKARMAQERQAEGASGVSNSLFILRKAYDTLEKGGGITNTEAGPLSNARAYASSSAAGQVVGKVFGTDNQSARNTIAMERPALMAAIMRATGMSAKQLDSNAELKLWITTATDPTLDVQANKAALDNIENRYLRNMNPSPTTPPAQSSGADKFTAGKIYTDANGRKAKYLGNGKWEEAK